jgi:thiamine-phosphate pyrophosphorylase
MSRAGRLSRLAEARLYLVIEAAVGGRPALPIVEAALRGGVDIVQLRDKAGTDEAILEAAEGFGRLCREHGALFVVNDRPDLAAAAGADGVHVGRDDVAPAAARSVVGPERLVGLSTHSPAQLEAAAGEPVDYVAVGPVYATATKPGYVPVGLELVRHAAEHAAHPWFAIGGIDAARTPEVRAAGAERIVVVRAIRDAEDPRSAAAALRAAIEEPARVRAG